MDSIKIGESNTYFLCHNGFFCLYLHTEYFDEILTDFIDMQGKHVEQSHIYFYSDVKRVERKCGSIVRI